jgi:hypothetical protein
VGLAPGKKSDVLEIPRRFSVRVTGVAEASSLAAAAAAKAVSLNGSADELRMSSVQKNDGGV